MIILGRTADAELVEIAEAELGFGVLLVGCRLPFCQRLTLIALLIGSPTRRRIGSGRARHDDKPEDENCARPQHCPELWLPTPQALHLLAAHR
jgi:hypothetical protein